jgi:hypothetical protein
MLDESDDVIRIGDKNEQTKNIKKAKKIYKLLKQHHAKRFKDIKNIKDRWFDKIKTPDGF